MNSTTFARTYLTGSVAWDEEDMNLVSRLAQAFLDYEETLKTKNGTKMWEAIAAYHKAGADLAAKNPVVYECWRRAYSESRGRPHE
jgi:hypothetical protein